MVAQAAIRTARQVLKVIPKKLAEKPIMGMTRANVSRIAQSMGDSIDLSAKQGFFTKKGSLSKLGKTRFANELQKLGLKTNATFKQVLLTLEKQEKAAAAAFRKTMTQADVKKAEILKNLKKTSVADFTSDKFKATFEALSKKFPQIKDFQKAVK